MNVTVDDLLRVIGEYEITVRLLRAQLVEAQKKLAEAQDQKPADA